MADFTKFRAFMSRYGGYCLAGFITVGVLVTVALTHC